MQFVAHARHVLQGARPFGSLDGDTIAGDNPPTAKAATGKEISGDSSHREAEAGCGCMAFWGKLLVWANRNSSR